MLRNIFRVLPLLCIAAILSACGSTAPSTAPSTPATKPAVQQTTQPETTAPQVAWEELVIIDNESCTFKITAIDPKDPFGYTLHAYLENKTDLELMFTVNNVSVNGFMCDPFWAVTVSAGMKANEQIRFSPSDFRSSGIEDVTQVEFTLDVYDSNDWLAEHLVTHTFSIFPLGEDAVRSFGRQPQPQDQILFDNEQCTMIVTGFEPDGMFGYTMNVYLENKTDKTLMFSADGAAVNGFMCDPLWATTVAPGKRSCTRITWMESSLADNGITQVATITLPIRVYDSNNWMADDILNQTFTVAP